MRGIRKSLQWKVNGEPSAHEGFIREVDHIMVVEAQKQVREKLMDMTLREVFRIRSEGHPVAVTFTLSPVLPPGSAPLPFQVRMLVYPDIRLDLSSRLFEASLSDLDEWKESLLRAVAEDEI